MAIEAAANDKTDNAIIRVWQQLGRLRQLSLTARPGPASQTGWRGAGRADIIAEADGGDWRLIERGRFSPAPAGRSVAFENIYRWRRAGDRLQLYHERFGASAAVFLFELVAETESRLTCRQPHFCGDDIYRGALSLTPTGFDLDWSISGPRKDEHLFYRYRTT